jgi:hypothetical protein
MDDLKEVIKNRFNQIEKYLESIKKYFSTVKVIIEGTNINDYRKINENIEFISKFITTDIDLSGLLSKDDKVKIITLNNLWSNLQKVYDAIDEFDSILLADKYVDRVIFMMSQSGGMEFKLFRMNIFNAHERLVNEIKDTDNNMFNNIIPTLNRGNCIEFLLTNDTANSFTTALMFYLMKTGNENERTRMRKLIENRKDAALGVTRKLLSGSENSIEDLPLLYGLIPACQVMPIELLLKEIGFGIIHGGLSKKEYHTTRTSDSPVMISTAPAPRPSRALLRTAINKSDLIKNLRNISNKSGEFGFVLLNRGSKSIIEFDIRGLISPSYVSALATGPNFGLNKKFIKRFSTVTHHNEFRGDDIINIIPENTNIKYVYIIDLFIDEMTTPNDAKISGRILSLELGKYKTQVDAVPGLLTGISSRPYKYNEILTDKILANYNDPLAEGIISTLGEIKSGKSSEAIKNTLLNSFLEHYDAEKPTTYDDFKALFTSWGELDGILIKAMMHIVHKQPTAEMLLTYLVKIDDVSRMFNAELELALKDANVSVEMFTQLNKEDLRKQLREITRQVVTTAANQLDQGNQWTKHSLSLKEHFIDKKFENI